MFESHLVVHESYIPLRFELEHLARLWWREYLDVSFSCFSEQQWSDSALRVLATAHERLLRLEKEVGERAFEVLRTETEERFSATVDWQLWTRFTAEEIF